MADASLLQHSFLGGEWSKFYQGRSDRPDYRTALNVCLNYIPIETGALVRRPGFGFAGTTRRGVPGRVIKFDFQEQAPYVVEFTDGFLRFWSGTSLATNNDAQPVTSISTANPAVVTVTNSLPTGATVMFTGLGASCPLLQNRRFTWSHISSTTGSIADEVTFAPIDGSTLGVGSLAATAQMSSIAEVFTPYFGQNWQTLRLVQAEQTAFLLHNNFGPQQLITTALPTASHFATFSIAPSFFEDGPYLDPIPDSILTASALSGVVNLSVSMPPYNNSQAYTVGDFVSFMGVGFESIADANIGRIFGVATNGTTAIGSNVLNFASTAGMLATDGVFDATAMGAILPGTTILSLAPTTATISTNVASPGVGNGDVIAIYATAFWKVVGLGAPINSGQGFLTSDIGRLVRLFSEPPAWAAATTYGAGSVVSYNPSGLPGQSTYWQSIAGSNTGNIPGTDITHWQLLAPGGQISSIKGVTQTATAGQLTVNPSTPVIWTWGKIIAISNVGLISGVVSGGANIGDMTGHGGLAAAFDGNVIKPVNACATKGVITGSGDTAFCGKNYTGAAAQTISQAVCYPSSDNGFFGNPHNAGQTITFELRAKATAPSHGGDGTLLGTAMTTAPGFAPVTILSSDTVTTWNYVWVRMIANNVTPNIALFAFAQVIFYTASAVPGTAISVEILGPPLLYSGTPINTWQLGVFSDTTGWPTVGTYSDGRLWLSGSVPNRFDSSVANGVNGIGNGGTLGSVNFAPTDQYGNVLASSGISYVLNGPDANPIFWMQPDLQGIILGTKAGEWLLTAPTSGGISPLNIAARRVTQIGAANIEPRRTEHTTVFVQKFNRKIMEYFADVFSGKFTAPHITEKSKHLTIGNIDEIAYQQELAPIVWARVAGNLVGWTYKRDTLMTSQGPTFAAGHRHILGVGFGDARFVESMAVGPSVGGNLDALTIVSNNPFGSNIRHVEVMTDIIDEGSQLSAASYLDDAVTPTSIIVSSTGITLNGLWHFNGETAVTAWLGGLDCGDYLVTNGSIIVPFGDGLGGGTANGLFTQNFVNTGITANGVTMFTPPMPMRVGFNYTSQGQIVRPVAPAESGARSGPAFGKMRRAQQYALQLEGCGVGAVSVGTDFNSTLLPVLFRQLNDTDYTIDLQFNGIFWNTLVDQYSRDGAMLAWQVTRPYIVNVVAVGEYLETQD